MEQLSKVDLVIRKLQGLPPLPAAVQSLCAMSEDPNASVRAMTQVISSDHALTGRILRVANSAFYGLSHRISTISQAIMIIGFQGVKNLALGLSLFGFGTGKKDELPVSREDFWRYALGVATAARLIAALMKFRSPEEAFTAGLLHDIGKMVLLEYLPEEYARVLRRVQDEGVDLSRAEKDEFGLTHCEVGAALCHHWKIPPALTAVIEGHDISYSHLDGRTEDSKMLLAVKAACDLTKIARIGSDGDGEIDPDFLKITNFEGLKDDALGQILLSLADEVRKAEIFFDMKPGEPLISSERFSSQQAGVFLHDAEKSEITRLILRGLGFRVAAAREILKGESSPIHCVVADFSIPKALEERFVNESVVLIKFGEYRSSPGVPQPEGESRLNIRKFQDWLTRRLTAISV